MPCNVSNPHRHAQEQVQEDESELQAWSKLLMYEFFLHILHLCFFLIASLFSLEILRLGKDALSDISGAAFSL